MGLREMKRAKLIDSIIEATSERIEEVGYEALQVEEVVRRLEISKPTFYRYFASKADVLAEVQLRLTNEWTAAVADLEAERAPFVDTLERLAQSAARELLAKPELNRAVYRHAPSVPSDRIREAEDRAGEVLIRLIRAAQASGEVADHYPEELVALILSAGIEAVSLAWARDEVSSEELEAALVLSVWAPYDGYRNRSEPVRPTEPEPTTVSR